MWRNRSIISARDEHLLRCRALPISILMRVAFPHAPKAEGRAIRHVWRLVTGMATASSAATVAVKPVALNPASVGWHGPGGREGRRAVARGVGRIPSDCAQQS